MLQQRQAGTLESTSGEVRAPSAWRYGIEKAVKTFLALGIAVGYENPFKKHMSWYEN